MNREILFRGKRVDNSEWIKGYFYKDRDLCYIYFIDTWVQVIPKTVGQYTGLKDKNGIRIFEGDQMIVRIPMGGFWGNVKTEKKGVVKYESDYGGYIIEWEYSKNQHHVLLNCDISFDSEITGNIHDSQELIGKEADNG